MNQDSQRLQTMIDRHEIAELNTIFAHSLDGGSVEAFLNIFTQDIDYRSGPRQLHGHDALREFFETRAASGRVSRHLICGQDIRFDGPDRATATSYWMVFAGEGDLPVNHCTPFQVADINDEVIRTPAGWKISHRVITSVFRNPDFAPAGGK